MSREELVAAYLDGQVSRRAFIRRLTAAGVSLGAAVSYAQLQGTEPARAGTPFNDHYPLVQLAVKTEDLGNVIQRERINVAVTVGEAMQLHIAAYLKQGNFLHVLGWAGPPAPTFSGPGTTTVRVKLPFVAKLHGLDKAKVSIQAQGPDGDDHYLTALGTTSATLRR
jgi:hypothetical protein